LEDIRKDWNNLLKLYNKMKYKKLIKRTFKYMHKLGIIIFDIEIVRITMLNNNEITSEFYIDGLLIRLKIFSDGKVINETL